MPSNCTEAGFLSPRSSKITAAKEKERRKRKSDEGELGGEEKKSNGVEIGVFWTKEVYLAITFPKIWLDMHMKEYSK